VKTHASVEVEENPQEKFLIIPLYTPNGDSRHEFSFNKGEEV
jgi:hypothetical protein